ncbi:MAG: hypothetical protein Kow0063_26020 [Anaerolineae bacterium]
MRILHVIPSIGPLRGGPSQAVVDMCRGLARAGMDVTLVTTDDNGPGHLSVPLGQPVEQDGYTVFYFRRTTRGYTFSWPLTTWLVRHIGDYDFVHAHAVFSYAPLLAAFLAHRKGIPYTITPHGLLLIQGFKSRKVWAKRFSYAFIEKTALNRATFIHVTSTQEAHRLRALKVYSPIGIIYFGIDTPGCGNGNRIDVRCLAPTCDASAVLLFLGRFHPIKGLDLLLPAFAQALKQAPGIVLALAGDGDADYKAWMEAEIARLGIGERVIWLGFLTGQEKWAALASSDVVVVPSYSESFGMVVVEAMACGKPVILSDQVAIHEEVASAGAGLVVPCAVERLAEAILELACDAELRKSMGQKGRALVNESFSPDWMSRRMLELYESAVMS